MHFQYEVALVLWCSLECTPPCQGGGRGFKSRQDRKTGVFTAVCGRVAQLAERPPEKRKVPGSMPGPTTIFITFVSNYFKHFKKILCN